MKALLINVNFDTGKRAGGCCPNDRNLLGHNTWQCQKQGLEIRIVQNGDVDRYRDVDGVGVLEDEEEIRGGTQVLLPAGAAVRRDERCADGRIDSATRDQPGRAPTGTGRAAQGAVRSRRARDR